MSHRQRREVVLRRETSATFHWSPPTTGRPGSRRPRRKRPRYFWPRKRRVSGSGRAQRRKKRNQMTPLSRMSTALSLILLRKFMRTKRKGSAILSTQPIKTGKTERREADCCRRKEVLALAGQVGRLARGNLAVLGGPRTGHQG